jgi:hypothetical protein
MSRSSLALLITILILSSCRFSKQDEGYLDGPQTFYYNDGKLYLEGYYVNNIAHGEFVQYYKNGNVYEVAYYERGILEGKMERYHDNGQLSMIIPYDSGIVHGTIKKFRRSGTIAYEAPYHHGFPCKGLKEYYTSGNPVSKIPHIEITVDDQLRLEGRYTLLLSVSGDMKAEFFKGELTDDLYIGDKAEPILTDSTGQARIDFMLPRGSAFTENLNIIAKVKSELKNYYIVERFYHLDIHRW